MKTKLINKEIDEVKAQIIDISLIFGSVLGIVVFLLSIPEYAKSGDPIFLIADLIAVLSLLLLAIFHKRASNKTKAYVIITALFLIVIMALMRTGVASANKTFLVVIPFFGILVFSLRRVLLFFIFIFICIGIVAHYHITGVFDAQAPESTNYATWIIHFLVVVIVAYVVLVITLKFNSTYQKLIGELIRSNQRTAEKERNYRKIFNASSDAIFILDLKGEIIDVNSAMLKMFGYKKTDLKDLDVRILSSGKVPYDSEHAKMYLEEAKHGKEIIFDWLARKKSGKFFWMEISLKKTKIGQDLRLLAVCRDIDEKKKTALELIKHKKHLENLVKERTERLIESEKMASVGVLAAGVAHEINNPLNFIKGGVLGIERYVEDHFDPEHKGNLDTLFNGINEGINRAANIVTSLNHYSRQDKSFLEECNIHTILDNCLTMLHNEIKSRIKIEKDYYKSSLRIKGNEGKLHQVFLNILTNALQAIHNTGKIYIGTSYARDIISIIIKDNGVGISKENLSKITDPFFTTKEVGRGTGLGLAIALRIIKDHNGNIQFNSELGQGTEVTILFKLND